MIYLLVQLECNMLGAANGSGDREIVLNQITDDDPELSRLLKVLPPLLRQHPHRDVL